MKISLSSRTLGSLRDLGSGKVLVGVLWALKPSLRKRQFATLAAVLFCVFGACSRSVSIPEFKDPKPVHSVKGKLLVAGKPAAGALVLFVPKTEQPGSQDPRPRAIVQADGSFTLSTYGDNDGAPAGNYTVAVNWEDPESKSDRFNGRYGPSSSRLSATVKEGANDLPPIELK